MSAADRERWDARYRAGTLTASAAALLRDNTHLLPRRGRALDLACGLGGNALLLAAHGLDTEAWDVSAVALATLAAQARAQGLALSTRQCDLDDTPLPLQAFDVIVVARFLDRGLFAALPAALRPGGLLFYETFNRLSAHGPANPDWKLADNELLAAAHGLRLRVYRDEWDAGDETRGLRGLVQLIAQKPA